MSSPGFGRPPKPGMYNGSEVAGRCNASSMGFVVAIGIASEAIDHHHVGPSPRKTAQQILFASRSRGHLQGSGYFQLPILKALAPKSSNDCNRGPCCGRRRKQ